MITKFAEGQVWTYATRPGESQSRITVVRLDDDDEYGTIVHIYISDLEIPNSDAPGGKTSYLAHMPFVEEALEESVKKMERVTSELPDYMEGYRLWVEAFENGEAGVFMIPVADAIDSVQESIS